MLCASGNYGGASAFELFHPFPPHANSVRNVIGEVQYYCAMFAGLRGRCYSCYSLMFMGVFDCSLNDADVRGNHGTLAN